MGMDFSAPSSLEARPPVPKSASSPRPSLLGGFSEDTVVSLGSPFDELLRDVHICLCSYRGDIVKDDGLSETWCFCQANISRDDVLEHLRSEVFSRVFGDLSREVETRVVHGEKHAIDSEFLVCAVLNAVHSVQQLRQAFECVVLALKRNEESISCHEHVNRDEAERRRAIDDDVVVVSPE